MDFYTMIKERLDLHYPIELNEIAFSMISQLETLQKAKIKNGKTNEKVLSQIVKSENELWKYIEQYQREFSIDLSIGEKVMKKEDFKGFDAPWEYIGIEKKLFSYLSNFSHLFYERDQKFPCTTCWSDPEQVTTYTFDVFDEKINRARYDWNRGVAKQRKYFKKGVHLYVCSTCNQWRISSKRYNPHG